MIKILVDSASDCCWGYSAYDDYVSLTVSIDGKDYKDGRELTADRFYQLLTSTHEFPKTSQPSPEEYFKIFRQAKKAGDEVLCFCISSAISGTYQSAQIAKDMIDYDGIYVIDTCMVSHLIGILTDDVKKRIAQNIPAGQIARECEALKGRVRVFAGLDTLEYLHKGGRLSRASAAVGQVAGIKPVVTFSAEGAVAVAGKAIGVPRAIQSIVSRVQEEQLDPAFPVYSLYTSGTQNTQKLEQKLTEAGIQIQNRLQVGPAIGAHVGPNVYGVVFVVKE